VDYSTGDVKKKLSCSYQHGLRIIEEAGAIQLEPINFVDTIMQNTYFLSGSMHRTFRVIATR